MTDYYSILGLDRECTREDVKNAYHRLAKQYHPDINKSPDSPEKFRMISEAYEYLIKVIDREQPGTPGPAGNRTGYAAAGGRGRTSDFRPLEEIMAGLNSRDTSVVQAAVEELGSRRFYGNNGVIAVLTGYLGSPDMMMRRNAVIALGRLGNPIAVAAIARLLADERAQIRFDATVALGNIGAPEALPYLERMGEGEPGNNEMVMNARDESIYWIKKKNRRYDTSRKCPSCGGYDRSTGPEPYVCHECGKSFGGAGSGPQGKYEPQANEKGDHSKKDTAGRCSFCRSEGPLEKCKYCGQSFCDRHSGPGEHHCWYVNAWNGGDESYSGNQSMFSTKVIRNLALLVVLLFLMLAIGAMVMINAR